MHSTQNPHIKALAGKETFYFNEGLADGARCDRPLEWIFNQTFEVRNASADPQLKVGEWTSTYFSCTCCPAVLRTINPAMKIVVLLRDPLQRTLSRLREQRALAFLNASEPFDYQMVAELDSLESCLKRAAPFRKSAAQAAAGGAGAGAGGDPAAAAGTVGVVAAAAAAASGGHYDADRKPDAYTAMKMQCLAKSHIIGYSMYDVWLENYLAHFPKEQLLVLYSEDMAGKATGAADTVKTFESFIGAPPHQYDKEALSYVYNTRGCYAWLCQAPRFAVKHVFGEANPRNQQQQLQGQQQQQQQQVAGTAPEGQPQESYPAQDEAAKAAAETCSPETLARLKTLLKPSVRRVMQMADRGIIAAVPQEWRETYGEPHRRRRRQLRRWRWW
ncbi:hypothetical protein HYH03_018799 [Edaphochlamys debaryana]|uniref:Sulfotransferase n=1 Tax=Edaphochlamys debaryana TaxID=47281 RepID=A0A835XJI1_9CHLO|nr:hypothetical protein HYH03_018799 [Edaphochlamys debaryana]|eukprot:KAG2482255.1 hypothetical protein HYH03_018799 [Edaphochlamys debaryana]